MSRCQLALQLMLRELMNSRSSMLPSECCSPSSTDHGAQRIVPVGLLRLLAERGSNSNACTLKTFLALFLSQLTGSRNLKMLIICRHVKGLLMSFTSSRTPTGDARNLHEVCQCLMRGVTSRNHVAARQRTRFAASCYTTAVQRRCIYSRLTMLLASMLLHT